MEEFVEFMLHYYREILLGLSLLLEILILIFKRRPVVSSYGLEDLLITAIKAAETTLKGASGEDKFVYVLDEASKKFPDLPAWYIVSKIESILETPTKKGGLGREKEKVK